MSNYNPTQIQQLQELGAYLRQQRLDQSLTLEQIATSTFIRLSILKALEQGKVDELPELVYVQGFLRRYGEALNLDGHELAHQISPQQVEDSSSEISPELVTLPPVDSMGEDLSSPLVRTQTTTKKQKKVASAVRNLMPVTDEQPSSSPLPVGSKFKVYGLYTLVLGGAVAGLFYLFSGSQSSEPSSQNQPQNQPSEVAKTSSTKTTKLASQNPQVQSNMIEPVTPESNTAQSTQDVAQPPSEGREEKPSTPTGVETRTNNAPNVTNTTPVPPNSESPVAASVALEGDSWMRVKVDGKTEYEGILEKGTQQTWTAQETLIIRAGNAGAVNLVVNDQPGRKLGNLGEVKEVTLTRDN